MMMKKLLLICLLVGAAVSTGTLLQFIPAVPEFGSISDAIDLIPPPPPPHVDTTLALVGDIMLARNVETVQNKYGASYVFEGLPSLASTTVLVGNFESSVPEVHVPTENMQMSFSTPVNALEGLRTYGFDFLSLANNHTYDQGADAFLNTATQIALQGIVPFGDQSVGTTSVTYVEINDVTVALFGLFALDTYPDIQVVKQQLQRSESVSDFQLVYVHWGTEYEPVHSSFQQRLARELVDLGFDAIVGHHPHVVQDIELYNGAYIFYSLGNFVFDQYWSDEVENGLWLELSFSNGDVRYQLRPVTSVGSRSQPRFMSAYDSDRFLLELAEKSPAVDRKSLLEGYLES